MEIEFKRNEKGELVAVDKETKKEIGKISTMGDEVKAENISHKK